MEHFLSGQPIAVVHYTAYLAWMRRPGHARAESTLKVYGQYLRGFVAWVGDRAWDDVSAAMIEDEYLAAWASELHARRGRGPAPKTVKGHHDALRSFYGFLVRRDYASRNTMLKLDAPVCEQRPNDYLRQLEDAALLDATRLPAEHIVVYLLRFAGLRSCEARGLLNRDVDTTASLDYPHGSITVRVSKTAAGRRVVPIFPELLPEVVRWQQLQAARGRSDDQVAFLATRHGTPFGATYLERTVMRVAARGGVRAHPAPDKGGHHVADVTPHTLRRTFGSWLINHGTPLHVVSHLLGHSSTTITERAYAQLEAQTVAASVFRHVG